MEAGYSYRGWQLVVREKHAVMFERVKKNANGLGKVAINDPSSAGRFGAPTQ